MAFFVYFRKKLKFTIHLKHFSGGGGAGPLGFATVNIVARIYARRVQEQMLATPKNFEHMVEFGAFWCIFYHIVS